MTVYDVCETAFGLRLLSFTSTLKGREIVEGGGARLVASIIINRSMIMQGYHGERRPNLSENW